MDSRNRCLSPCTPAYASGPPSGLIPNTSLLDTKRKHSLPEARIERLEGMHLSRKDKTPSSMPSNVGLSLTKEALREHNAQNRNMRTSSSLKRSSSQRSITGASDLTSETSKSAISVSKYRFTYLAAVGIRPNADMPPDIKTAVDTIVESTPSQERSRHIKHVAQVLHEESVKLLSGSSGEDDCVHIFLQALRAIRPHTLCYHEKADWAEELKPPPRQSTLKLGHLSDLPVPTSPSSPSLGPLPKRQRASSAKLQSSVIDSNEAFQLGQEPLTLVPPPRIPPTSTKLPPTTSSTVTTPPKKQKEHSFVKTPRPDITIGIDIMELISRLKSAKISNVAAEQLLSFLQSQSQRHLQGTLSEPLLISVPAARATNLAFPFAVVDGKGYSTGKPIFEAQNQAAVAGACALKIQLDLDDVTSRAVRNFDESPTFSHPTPLLFFSVCTEGPIYELWAHYVLDEGDSKTFASHVLNICHSSLLESVEAFLVAFDSVCQWGVGGFLDYVVERLELVAKSTV